MEIWDRSVRHRDAAAAVLQEQFPKLDIQPDEEGVFALHHSGVAEGRWVRQTLRVDGSVTMTGSTLDAYAVGRVVDGRAALRYGAAATDMAVPYLRAVGDSELRAEDASLELIVLEPVALEDSARRYLAGSGRRLIRPSSAHAAPVSPSAAALWDAARHYARLVAADERLRRSELMRDQVHDLLVRTLLTAFPVTVEAGVPTGSSSGATPRSVRRALEHMDEHPGEAITIAGLAEIANCSVRALQAGIRRHTGITATQYLRERRLDAAHAELLEAEPGSISVATVARNWGFAHMSRFSRDYAERFGEYPRETLGS